MAEMLESDLPAIDVEDRDGRTIRVPQSFDDIADSSLDPARMTDEERAAIVAGELGRQFQPIAEGRRYFIHRNRSLKFVWLSSQKLRELWERGDDEREAVRLILSMVRECRLSRGEKRIAAATVRMADTEPAAFIAPPIGVMPIATGSVTTSDGTKATRFDAWLTQAMPVEPQPTRFPARGLAEAEIERAIESLQALKIASAQKQQAASTPKPARLTPYRENYWHTLGASSY
jgi:hypothetical protein